MTGPAFTDSSPSAKAARLRAVKNNACPKCGAAKGLACKPKKGGYYNPRYTVHRGRMSEPAKF